MVVLFVRGSFAYVIYVTRSGWGTVTNITGPLQLCNRSVGFRPNVARFTERSFRLADRPSSPLALDFVVLTERIWTILAVGWE
jgi:hypothetical protein